jgi:hypothetical protein
MKKFLLLSALVMFSCSNDNSSTNETNLKLIKETITTTNTSTTKSYVYENNLLSKIMGGNSNSIEDDQTFVFNNGKLIQIKLFTRQNIDDIIKPTTLTMLYDGDNISSVTSTFDDNSGSATSYTNTYINNRLDFQTDNNGNQGFRHEYYDTGNLHKIKNNNSDIFVYNSYDTKKNPYFLVYPDPYLRMQIYSPNNMLNVSGNNNIETYEYEYNSYDYPTKVIKRVNGIIQSTTIFTYNN